MLVPVCFVKISIQVFPAVRIERARPLIRVCFEKKKLREKISVWWSEKVFRLLFDSIFFHHSVVSRSVGMMKPMFSSRTLAHVPHENEVLTLLFAEIKNTQNFFPSDMLKGLLEE